MSRDGKPRQRDLDDAADPLSAFWNGVVSGAAARPVGLEPELADTVLRLHAVPLAPRLRASRQEQIWSELITSNLVSPEPLTIVPSQHRSQNVGALSKAHRAGSLPAGRRWPVSQFATMALILFTVLASFLIFPGLRRWSATLGPEPWPVSDLPPAVIADTVLMRGTVDALPATATWISIDRVILPPDAEWALDANDGEGPLLYWVESGQLTITADGPIRVTRTDADQGQPVSARTDVVLEPGDQGFTPSGVTSRWRNDGTSPAMIIDARISTLQESHPAGVTRYALVYDHSFSPPSSPFLFTVRRLTLSPKAELPVDQVPGLRLLFIESGQLQAREPQRPEGFRVVNGAGAARTFPPGRVFLAGDAEPVTLLLLTITASNPLTETPLG